MGVNSDKTFHSPAILLFVTTMAFSGSKTLVISIQFTQRSS